MQGDDRARVTLSPIATPLPLTFVGLLLASTILSGLELGWIPRPQAHEAGWALIGVPVPLQLVAAVFGFRGRSATAATGSSTLAAGWFGVAVAAVALYAAFALELEGSTERAVLPTFRHAQSSAALVGPLELQVDRLEHEAGIRKNL